MWMTLFLFVSQAGVIAIFPDPCDADVKVVKERGIGVFDRQQVIAAGALQEGFAISGLSTG